MRADQKISCDTAWKTASAFPATCNIALVSIARSFPIFLLHLPVDINPERIEIAP